MKISTRGRYGTRLMLDLALHYGKGNSSLKDIAARQEISEKYLWHLVPPLRNAGLINSQRGARGGYVLAKPPAQITLKDIITILEGNICLVECGEDLSVCGRADGCVTGDIWREINKTLSDVLASYTLEDLALRHRNKYEDIFYTI